jgi:hypothetical protein
MFWIAAAWVWLSSWAWSAELPADLDAVPRHAVGFAHLRAADLWRCDALAELRRFVDSAGKEVFEAYESNLPVPPSNLDRITLILLTPESFADPFPTPAPEAFSAVAVIATKKPIDRMALRKNLAHREKKTGRHIYYFYEPLWAGVVLIDDRTFLVASEDALIHYLKLREKDDPKGPLTPALREAAGTHLFTLGINPAPFARQAVDNLPKNLAALASARLGIITTSGDKESQVNLTAEFPSDDDTKSGEKAVRDLLDLALAGLKVLIHEAEQYIDKLKKDEEDEHNPFANHGLAARLARGGIMLFGLGMLRDVEEGLKSVKVQRDGTTVRIRLDAANSQKAQMAASVIGAELLASGVAFGRAVRFSRIAASSGEDANPEEFRLKHIADAIAKYRDEKGHYPPPAIYDERGNALLSWRVALLPYLGDEAEELHRQFRLDEPWDSLHNKKLIARMPECFRSLDNDLFLEVAGKTTTVVFVGPGSIFNGPKGVNKDDVNGKTVLLGIVGSPASVYWTKPADVRVIPEEPLPKLVDLDVKHIHVLTVDQKFEKVEMNDAGKALREKILRKQK